MTSEAELARARIEELKKQQEEQARQEILAQQAVERDQVDLAHKQEYDQFNADWNAKMEETQQSHLLQITETQQRHEQELAAYQEQLDQQLPLTGKYSAETLNQRKIQETLANQKNYKEALKVKAKVQQLEKRDEAAWREGRTKKVKSLNDKFLKQQQNEMHALQKKIEMQEQSQINNREIELEILLKKYNNVKTELANQQRLELTKIN